VDFFSHSESWKYQKWLYQYIIARWGYSRSLGLWHTVSEIDGTNAGSSTSHWHRRINEYFVKNDPFQHPTSASRGDVSWWNGLSEMGSPQVHNYQGAQDEVGIASNIASTTEWLFRDYDKPNFHGEVGKKQTDGEWSRAVYQHNASWAALVSGAAINPLMWNDGHEWGEQSSSMYESLMHFREFTDSLDLPREGFKKAFVRTSLEGGRVWGLVGKQTMIAWLQDTSPGEQVNGAVITFNKAQWSEWEGQAFHPWAGEWKPLGTTVRSSSDEVIVRLPSFQRDMAVRLMVKGPPRAPLALKARALSRSQIKISWKDRANNESGFYLQRKEGFDGPWKIIAQLDANIIVYVDERLKSQTPYVYRVAAYNAQGQSSYSNEGEATTLTAEGQQENEGPFAPEDLSDPHYMELAGGGCSCQLPRARPDGSPGSVGLWLLWGLLRGRSLFSRLLRKRKSL
jgi:hypothetical protein